jgi:hypothetical protein
LKAVAATLGIGAAETVCGPGSGPQERGGHRSSARHQIGGGRGVIDAHRQVFGVASICRVLTSHALKIATSACYVAKFVVDVFS